MSDDSSAKVWVDIEALEHEIELKEQQLFDCTVAEMRRDWGDKCVETDATRDIAETMSKVLKRISKNAQNAVAGVDTMLSDMKRKPGYGKCRFHTGPYANIEQIMEMIKQTFPNTQWSTSYDAGVTCIYANRTEAPTFEYQLITSTLKHW